MRRPKWQMVKAAHVFCTQKCYHASPYRSELVRMANRGRNPDAKSTTPCGNCGAAVERYVSSRGEQAFCSNDCHNDFRRARQTKKLTATGYVRMFVGKGHPGAMKSGQILEHRKVMQDILGRPLLPEENVHHINGVRDDNRPENLELWSYSQPQGQRVEDKLRWAREFLAIYEEGLTNGATDRTERCDGVRV